jgi:acetyltransferase-like isoleucine patch superfamily enzyme
MSHNIKADEIILGKNVIISPKAIIRGVDGNAKKITIGDNTYIGDNVQIILDEFEIGDYCKIHHHTNLHGYKPMKIGHNAWVGQYTIIDSIGGVNIGNNCGIGAHSQLWSHIKYGDPLQGCNYNMSSPLVVEDDVWFVGHCIVSPITAKSKSMALAGSVVTKDMEENRIYGGTPAKDLTDKILPQYTPLTLLQKWDIINQLQIPKGIKFIEDESQVNNEDDISYFNIVDRTYTKKRTEMEISFMKYLQSKLIKFIPKN